MKILLLSTNTISKVNIFIIFLAYLSRAKHSVHLVWLILGVHFEYLINNCLFQFHLNMLDISFEKFITKLHKTQILIKAIG